ncbi:MAG: sulfotransferase family protein [Candidatus Heimdallarchaeota archaeon]
MDKELIAKSNEQTLTGTSLWNWIKLQWENRKKLDIKLARKYFVIWFMTIISIPAIWYEKIVYNRLIKKTKIEKPPIFILGHWRSGTTYLHMLLTQDTQFSYASNFQTIFPLVFLGSRWFYAKILDDHMPKQRRQDNFKLGIDQPGEEEFALSNMSTISFYHSIQFPNRREHYAKYITFEGIPEEKVRKWKRLYKFYLKKLTYASKGKQLIMKNPPNTGRVKELLELFPDAKFIHIYRDPYKVHPSTVKMYDRLLPPFYLQYPDIETADEIILDIYEQIHKKYFKEKHLIPKENLIEIRYEDLLAEPFNKTKEIYKKLSLTGFSKVESKIQEYVGKQKTYQPNTHTLDDETTDLISDRLDFAFKEFGYPKQSRKQKRKEKRKQRKSK